MTDDQQARAELQAEIEGWFAGPPDPLDVVREMAEVQIGQPCIARYVDDRHQVIEVQTPVIRMRLIRR